MTKTEKIEKLRSLQEGYILYSVLTKLPFAECEGGTFLDRAFLFETQEDATAAAEKFCNAGDIVAVGALKAIELPAPEGAEIDGQAPKMYRSQVREHMMSLPNMGVDAIYFKPAEDDGQSLLLDEILPAQVKQANEEKKKNYCIVSLQLSGIYFAQYVRRQGEKDPEKIDELSEEFYANMVRSALFVPVIPEGLTPDGQPDMTRCKIPGVPMKKAGSEEESVSFMSAFTNMDEVVAFCRNFNAEDAAKVKVLRIPFKDMPRHIGEHMAGLVVDPLSIRIPVMKEDVKRMASTAK